jgi:8-oxo-dGTP pyrophosphatase MutT (NUDIX family)
MSDEMIFRAHDFALRTLMREHPIPAAAVAFVRDSPQGIEVYLSRRPAHFRYYPGAFVFPGGRRDVDDIDIKATAAREVFEEIGIEIDCARLVPLRDINTSAHAGPVYHMITFAYPIEGEFSTTPNAEEVEEEMWIAAHEAVRRLELPYQITAAVHTIAQFASVAELLRGLEQGSINEDYWF